MFLNAPSKEIATILEANSAVLKNGLYSAFDASLVGCTNELQFLRSLIKEITRFLAGLSIPGVQLGARLQEIHQKPIVIYGPDKKQCELGDLLVVVKYYDSLGSFEAKSIIYQIKLAKKNTTRCDIIPKQLDLLCDWPSFSFGKASSGGPQSYTINPVTLEFGSFLLEQRAPQSGNYLQFKHRCYGVGPHARLVRQIGPYSIDITQPIYARGDANNFFSHLVFEIGEHHSNQPVRDLIEALYRYAGLSPDPPCEFDGYSSEEGDGGFAVLEISVKRLG